MNSTAADLEIAPIKPGWKTTEFYLSLATAILPWLAVHLPDQWKATLSVVSAAVYAISRGIAKFNP
jgi:hypothetical protein